MSDPVPAAAEAVTARLLAEHPADRPRVRADLDALPAPVARRLRAGLDRRVAETAALPVTPWVDADDAEVEAAARSWRTAAHAAARVPGGAWAATLEAAVWEALAHLVRPAPTLAAWAFRDEPEEGGDLPTGMAIERTRAFGPFPYLPEIAARYADRKGAERIDRAGLERLFDQIDRRMTEPFGTDEWSALLGPLYDVVGGAVPAPLLRAALGARGADALAGRFTGDGAVSAVDLRARIAKAAFPTPPAFPKAAKPDDSPPSGAGDAREATSADAAPPAGEGGVAEDETAQDDRAEPHDAPPPRPARSEARVSPEAAPDETAAPPRPPVVGSRWRDPESVPADDSAILGGPRPAAPAEELEVTAGATGGRPSHPDPPSDAVADEAEPPDEAEDREVEEPTAPPVVGGAEEPLWRRIARQQGVEVIETAGDEAAAEGGAAPLWQRFAEPATAPLVRAVPAPAPPSGSLDDVERRVLGEGADDRRDGFVAELFGGSADDYHRTLLALDGARSWTEATQIIARDVFQKHRVNIYSDPAVAFTDAVEANVGR